jgi:hypothetical protein
VLRSCLPAVSLYVARSSAGTPARNVPGCGMPSRLQSRNSRMKLQHSAVCRDYALCVSVWSRVPAVPSPDPSQLVAQVRIDNRRLTHCRPGSGAFCFGMNQFALQRKPPDSATSLGTKHPPESMARTTRSDRSRHRFIRSVGRPIGAICQWDAGAFDRCWRCARSHHCLQLSQNVIAERNIVWRSRGCHLMPKRQALFGKLTTWRGDKGVRHNRSVSRNRCTRTGDHRRDRCCCRR